MTEARLANAFEAYERVVALGGNEAHAERVAEMRRLFEARTGVFRAEDRWFEARSRAFWDDAVTRQGFAREVSPLLAEEARAWVTSFDRAHRGLFRTLPRDDESADETRVVLSDVWGGADFVVDLADDSTREALDAATGLFDARLVALASPPLVAILPGALFHPEDATEAILAVVATAREKALGADEVLDALLRMERNLRSLSRVKAAYAYRADALTTKAR